MNLLEVIRSMFQSKASQARVAMSVERLGQPVTSPANYLAFSKEGYQKNAIVYRCIRLIAMNCAGIKWDLYTKGKNPREIEEHPILTLMDKPNPMQGWGSLFEAFISYLAISGNGYMEAIGPESGKPPMELWTVRPDLMKIIPNALGYPSKYCFKYGSQEKYWDVDVVSGKSPILHTKTFNPTDIWYGMSPMESAILGVDQYNHSNKWNLALLQNSASPSGVLRVETTDANPTGAITTDQYNRLKQEFYEAHTSSRNAGKPLLLEGGVAWQSISLSPKEMEWLKGREVSGADICNVYGVPSMMLGFGQMTYANYKEARQAFFEDTILPIMDMMEFELNRWLVPMFGDGVVLKYDKDDIEALVEKRESKYASLASANWLTQNEKRIASGHDPQEGWDVFVISNQILEKPPEEDIVEEVPPISEAPEGGTDNGEEETSEEDQETSSTEEVDAEDGEKGWKSFNLLNRNEKSSTWRRVNSKRKHLEKPFSRSLESDFDDLAKQLAKAATGKDPKVAEYAMNKVIDEGMADISKTLKRYIRYSVEDFGKEVFQNAKSQLKIFETKKNEKTWNDWADKYINRRTARSITEIEGTTRKQVRRVVQELVSEAILNDDAEGSFARDLQDKFESLSSGRARTIARTEIGMASNSATLEAAKSLEIPGLKKEWVSLQDDRTRDGEGPNIGEGANHYDMNGVEVELDDKFTVPPDADMDGPGDEAGGAEQVCNCRCTLVFKTGIVR
jgi:HK97 family phage portal protein